MKNEDSGRGLGLPDDSWLRNILARVPTLFGRLVYLSSLLDRNTGRHKHYGLSQAIGEAEAGRILREAHCQAFAEWLGWNLEERAADLDSYLSGLGEDRQKVLETWASLQPYRDMPPPSAEEVERKLFLAELGTLLSILSNKNSL